MGAWMRVLELLDSVFTQILFGVPHLTILFDPLQPKTFLKSFNSSWPEEQIPRITKSVRSSQHYKTPSKVGTSELYRCCLTMAQTSMPEDARL